MIPRLVAEGLDASQFIPAVGIGVDEDGRSFFGGDQQAAVGFQQDQLPEAVAASFPAFATIFGRDAAEDVLVEPVEVSFEMHKVIERGLEGIAGPAFGDGPGVARANNIEPGEPHAIADGDDQAGVGQELGLALGRALPEAGTKRPEELAGGGIEGLERFRRSEQDLGHTRQLGRLGRAEIHPPLGAGPAGFPGISVESEQSVGIGSPGIDEHKIAHDERRTREAPDGELGVDLFHEVAFPEELAGGGVVGSEQRLGAQGEELAPVKRGGRAGAGTGDHVGESDRLFNLPDELAGLGVETGEQLGVAPLLLREEPIAHAGERRPAGADRLPPEFARGGRGPVERADRPVDATVHGGAAEHGPVVRADHEGLGGGDLVDR